MKTHKIKQLLSFFLLSIFLTNCFSIFGQTRRNTTAKNRPAKSEKKAICDGGWSGIVTFKKTLKDSLETADQEYVRP